MMSKTTIYRGYSATATVVYDRRARMWLVKCEGRGVMCASKKEAVTAMWDAANSAAIRGFYEKR